MVYCYNTPDGMVDKVNELIGDGYIPHGGVSIASKNEILQFAQAMVLRGLT